MSNDLGMATAMNIIERHGGEILVESNPRAGNSFTLRLPMAETLAGDGQDRGVPRNELTRSRGRGRANPWPRPIPRQDKGSVAQKPSILIVDDDANLRVTMSLILRRKGYFVTTAKGGREAIEELTRRPFHVIFMDITMPGMNGLDTLRRIREMRPEAVVIMMTSHAGHDSIREAIREGAYGVVQKPLETPAILALIERATKRATVA